MRRQKFFLGIKSEISQLKPTHKNIKRLNRISKRRKNDSRQAFKNGFNTLSGNLTRQEQGRETDFNQMLIIQKVRNFWLYNISY